MRAGTKVHLSVPGKSSVKVGGGANNHSKLINLDFTSSGHTGFQRELTAEQLANIDAVQNKEDISNKIQSLNLATGDEAQYPSAKAVVDEIFRVDTQLTSTITTVDKKTVENKVGIQNAQEEIKEIKTRVPKLIRKITVKEDVASVTITTDEKGETFTLTDFEIRFTGKHSTTMWMTIGKGEKYFSTGSVANNSGLPFFNKTTDYFMQNVIASYKYSGTNFYGIKYQQEFGPLADGKYSAGAGEVVPFNTAPVDSSAKSIVLQAISGGVINAGTVIEVWGY